MDGILDQFQQRYQQLRAMREAGQLSPQQFLTELQRLRWQDGRGVWWTINQDGIYMYFDGRQWILAQPVQIIPNPPQAPAKAPAAASYKVQVPAQPRPAASLLPVQTPPAPRTTKSGLSLRKFAPILAIIPSLVLGALWFLYTLIGAFRTKSIGGLDCITPLIVGGLPLLFLVLKKPSDKLLLPLKPIIQRVPKLLRLGIALAVPLLLGCGCSTITSSGYLALNVSAFISVMTAGVLLRF